jgi:uncharacterized membrane protein
MPPWLLSHFLNPGFVLAGTALVSAPIIIHLINRLRFRRVRFAAMEFLLASQQRNRRRVLIEQLLLLLLRILLVLGLTLLIARLILDPSQLSVFQGARIHHLVLLDDSGSMRDRQGETTAFGNAIAVVKKLVAEGSRRPGTQVFSLVLLSHPEQPVFSQRDVNESLVAELEAKLEHLRPSHRALSLVDGLNAAKLWLGDKEERGAVKHLHVLSDFRDRDWQDQQALTAAAESLDSAGVTLNLVKTVEQAHANLSVTDLSGDLQVAAAGVPVRLRVKVKNHAEQSASDVRLSVYQDGQKLPLSLVFEKIEAGSEAETEFDLVFETPQKHEVRVSLEGDSLAEDNSRLLALETSAVHKVLVVDGDPSGDEGSYVVDALAADPRITGFAPQIETVDYLRRRPIDEFQAIYLLNVADLPADALDPLEKYVAAGGGLAWFVGGSVKPAFYNEALYKEGQGLFPVPLEAAPRDLPVVEDGGPDLVLAAHPIFRVFEGQENPYLDVTRVARFFPVAASWNRDDQARGDHVQTIATLRNRQPLMFHHRFGKGNVITCLTTCGPAWNNWAKYASYVVLQLELQKFIARRDRQLEKRLAGEPIVLSLDASEFSDQVEIFVPDPAGERSIRIQATPAAASSNSETRSSNSGDSFAPSSPQPAVNLRLAATFRDTDLPGIYRVRLIDLNQVPVERWIAYNFPTAESDLALATNDIIRKQLGDKARVTIQEPGQFAWIAGREIGSEVRDVLLLLLAVILLAEQLLSYRLSYHRQPLFGSRR